MEHRHKIGGSARQQRVAEKIPEIRTERVVSPESERFGEPANPELQLTGVDPTIRIGGMRARMCDKMYQPGQHWQRSEKAAQEPRPPCHALVPGTIEKDGPQRETGGKEKASHVNLSQTDSNKAP